MGVERIEAAKNPAPAKSKETSQGQREALTKALYPAKPGAKKDAAGGYAPIEPHQAQFEAAAAAPGQAGQAWAQRAIEAAKNRQVQLRLPVSSA